MDSITRQFDIASFYFYVSEDGSWDCVDGRQRIGAIMSFLDENPGDLHHRGFDFKVLNEIFPENDNPNEALEDKSWREINELAKAKDGDAALARQFIEIFLDYKLTVIMLHDSAAPEEFNLQFTRLNLGTIINSGEKLNAMIGQLRDVCFEDLAKHDFLQSASIPDAPVRSGATGGADPGSGVRDRGR